MRLPVCFAALVMSMLAQGCSLAIVGERIEPTDLSLLKHGVSREKVESVLGEPISHDSTKVSNVALYGYDKGASVRPVLSEEEYLKCWGVFNIFCEPVLTPMALIKRQEKYDAQRGQLGIHFAKDDTVLDFVIGKDFPGDSFWEKFSRAVCGDPGAQYQIGDAIESGRTVQANDFEAFKWYTISASRNHRLAADVSGLLAEKLSNEDVALAERLAEKWVPNLEGCERPRTPQEGSALEPG